MCAAMVKAVATIGKRSIVWFRNDLRIHDNAVLTSACSQVASKGGDLLCIYCFDPRHYVTTKYGDNKTGVFRSQFLIDSVENLRKNLKGLGSELLVSYTKPEDLISQLTCSSQGALETTVFVAGEVTSEELSIERAVEQSILTGHPQNRLVRIHGGHTLYHPEDLPYQPIARMPDTFTPYKEKVEKLARVRPLLPTPRSLPALEKEHALPSTVAVTSSSSSMPPTVSITSAKDDPALASTKSSQPIATKQLTNVATSSLLSYLPSLADLYSSEPSLAKLAPAPSSDPRGVLTFHGGEDAGLQRIQQWMFDQDLLKDYFEMRNGLLGADYSSKFSPWLANGCISPRYIYYQVKEYERQRKLSNKSTYWLIFELLWRDFFYSLTNKYNPFLFYSQGCLSASPRAGSAGSAGNVWRNDPDVIQAWKIGQTGIPFVDANMRELAATGWMSNRGRQNVASYFINDLQQDWRVGAYHFECLLLDHDVASNYGNWNAAAGLTGGRINRFNMLKQSKDYDSEGKFIITWCPELQEIPAPMIFEPWLLTKEQQSRYGVKLGEDYPYPITPGSSSSGGRGGSSGGRSNASVGGSSRPASSSSSSGAPYKGSESSSSSSSYANNAAGQQQQQQQQQPKKRTWNAKPKAGRVQHF